MTGEPGKSDQPSNPEADSDNGAVVSRRTSEDAEAALRQYEMDQARQTGQAKPGPESDKPIPSAEVKKPAHRRRWFGLRRPTTLIQTVLLGALMILMVLGLWWLLTAGENEDRVVSPTILPSPQETFASLNELLDERKLIPNTGATIRRVALGFALATIVGVPLGVLAGCFAPIRAMLAPLVIFGRNIPIAALIPITMVLFLNRYFDAAGETQKIMFIFIACVAFIIADTTTAISDVGQKYVDTAYTLGATRWQVILKVLFPLAMPSVFNSLRLLFGLAFGYIMLAELYKSADGLGGLGHLINMSQRRGKYDHIYLIILIIPLLALVIDWFLFFIQRQLFPYRYESRGLADRFFNGMLRSFFPDRPEFRTFLQAGFTVLLGMWDGVKTRMLGPKPPFDQLVNETEVDHQTGGSSTAKGSSG